MDFVYPENGILQNDAMNNAFVASEVQGLIPGDVLEK
jgi:hypothetical protein